MSKNNVKVEEITDIDQNNGPLYDICCNYQFGNSHSKHAEAVSL